MLALVPVVVVYDPVVVVYELEVRVEDVGDLLSPGKEVGGQGVRRDIRARSVGRSADRMYQYLNLSQLFFYLK
jgi:hypothetical protein